MDTKTHQKIKNPFGEIKLSVRNLDRYVVRSSIFKAIIEALPRLNGNLLDVGCGKMPYREYILKETAVETYTGLDIEGAIIYDKEVQPDHVWDGVKMPLADASFDCILLTEVLEHCHQPELVINECFRVLKPEGILFFTVPFLWPLHEVPHDHYRYTPFALEKKFIETGFIIEQLKPLGGYDASLAVMLGLWLNRHLGASKPAALLRYMGLPVIKWLYKRDVIPENLSEGVMITGLTGLLKRRDN